VLEGVGLTREGGRELGRFRVRARVRVRVS